MPSKFVEAVNTNGEKQRIPAAWLADGSPFAGQFKLPPSGRQAKQSAESVDDKRSR